MEKEVDISKITSHPGEQEEILSAILEYLGTHPFINNRIRHLIDFAGSECTPLKHLSCLIQLAYFITCLP